MVEYRHWLEDSWVLSSSIPLFQAHSTGWGQGTEVTFIHAVGEDHTGGCLGCSYGVLPYWAQSRDSAWEGLGVQWSGIFCPLNPVGEPGPGRCPGLPQGVEPQ